MIWHEKSSFALGHGIVQPSLNPDADSKPVAPDQAIPYHIMKTRRTPRKDAPLIQPLNSACQGPHHGEEAYLVDDEYLVTAFVPSDTACLASSPGRMSRTLQKNKRLVREGLWT